jgi:hypothetical protein
LQNARKVLSQSDERRTKNNQSSEVRNELENVDLSWDRKMKATDFPNTDTGIQSDRHSTGELLDESSWQEPSMKRTDRTRLRHAQLLQCYGTEFDCNQSRDLRADASNKTVTACPPEQQRDRCREDESHWLAESVMMPSAVSSSESCLQHHIDQQR